MVTWGDEAGGADSSHVQKDLFSVKQVVASFDAFAAVRSSEEISKWRSLIFFGGPRVAKKLGRKFLLGKGQKNGNTCCILSVSSSMYVNVYIFILSVYNLNKTF